MNYILAWRYNDKCMTESHNNLPDAVARLNILHSLGYTDATLHIRNI